MLDFNRFNSVFPSFECFWERVPWAPLSSSGRNLMNVFLSVCKRREETRTTTDKILHVTTVVRLLRSCVSFLTSEAVDATFSLVYDCFFLNKITCVVGIYVCESLERWTNRIQRAGHLCHRQEYDTDGKLNCPWKLQCVFSFFITRPLR